MTTRKISKGKVVEDLCTLLKTDDYSKLVPQIQELVKITGMPPRGIMITWKPFVPGSLNFTIMGFPVADIASLQESSQICGLVSQELSTRAIQVAQQNIKTEMDNNDQREPINED